MESPGFKAIFRNDGVVYRSGAVETTLRFSGTDPHVVIEPIERISGTVNFLIGADASHWKTGVHSLRDARRPDRACAGDASDRVRTCARAGVRSFR